MIQEDKGQEQLDINEGSYWFKRFVREIKSMYNDIELRKIKHGFYRIYWTGTGYPAYVGECYKEMPRIGYEINDKDINLVSKKYYEEYEDQVELTRKLKNFVEGYYDLIDRFKTNMYLIRNNKEHRDMAIQRYKTFVIK